MRGQIRLASIKGNSTIPLGSDWKTKKKSSPKANHATGQDAVYLSPGTIDRQKQSTNCCSLPIVSLPVVIWFFACCSPLSTKATSAFQAASGRSRNSNSLGGGTGEANSLLIKTTSTQLNIVRREWLNNSGVGGPTSEGMDALCQFWLQTENTRRRAVKSLDFQMR